MSLSWLENGAIGLTIFLIILALDQVPALAKLARGFKALIAAIAGMLAVFMIDALL